MELYHKIKGGENMEYEDVVMDQLDRTKKSRNNPDSYALNLDTLIMLLPRVYREKIRERQTDLNCSPYPGVAVVISDYDTLFEEVIETVHTCFGVV